MSAENNVIPWWLPEINGSEWPLVRKVIDSNFLNDGKVTEDFESRITDIVGTRYAVGVTSGTTALYLSLLAAGVGVGDEVVVPDMTFIATANAVAMTGAKVVLVDVDEETLTMSPEAFGHAITPKTKAVIPVHVSGRGGTLNRICEIAKNHGIAVVEDAAEALGSVYCGKKLGSFGLTGCFSFSPNKTITTGQGGMIVTNDEAVHVRLRELKDQGRPVRGTGGDDVHASFGSNFKLTNLQSAVGLGQLESLASRMERQRSIHRIYRNRLKDLLGLRVLPFNVEGGECPQWTDVVVEKRNELDAFLKSRGAHCRRFWFPIHTQKPYFQKDDAYPNSTKLSPQSLWLPSAFQMTDADAERVCGMVCEFFKQ